MTRFLAIISCLILMLGLCIGVSAEGDTRASTVNIFATVSDDGSAQVSTNVTLHVTEPLDKLVFPVPANASGISLNGSSVITDKTDSARLVDLSRVLKGMTGDISFTVSYNLGNGVRVIESTDTEEETVSKKLRLELPLLSGFTYPIDQLQYSINLPGNVTQDPMFSSGYHQEDIAKDLSYSISGGNIAGRTWVALKDHETLTMYMDVTEEMFPQTRVELPAMDKVTILIGICVGAALLYWFLMLRNFLPLRSYPAVAPEGFGAGQMGSILTMSGTDLCMMVFSWAQLGYLTIRMDRRGRVLLLRGMEMGNERTDFEQKCFYKLFSRRDVVDTASPAFQKLRQAVAVQNSASELFRTRNALSIKIFRLLMAAAGLLCGTCFGIVLGNLMDFGWLFMLVLSLAGLVCSWNIQHWTHGIFLRQRFRLLTAVAMAILWLVLGISVGQFGLAALAVFLQVLAGFLAVLGGRRTEEGRNAMGQVISLRHYLANLAPKQIQQNCRDNPEFFFDCAPYAIALGCDNKFARRFGKSKLPPCPYIQAASTRGMTAKQWAQLMHHLLDNMTSHQKGMLRDQLHGVLGNYMK